MGETGTYYVGVDVGTKSVRAALVSSTGDIIRTASSPIKIWNPCHDFYEQSSNDIWQSCVKVVQSVTRCIDKEKVCGLGFDATCSLVAVSEDFEPVSVSVTGINEQNIILWMDHRAMQEAKFITSLSHKALKSVGGKMSLEMQPPKMLWIKKNLPAQWRNIKHFFDLPDFLTFKATGCLSRSLCSLVCKFLYQPEENVGWDSTFWEQIGLEDIVSNSMKIGNEALPPGHPCGKGLTPEAAKDFELLPNTPVSTSVIDCYAGGIGVLACKAHGMNRRSALDNRMALISGTSACHVKVHKEPILTSGVWGPYFSAMIPQMYCVEAGQSVAGALIDHIVNIHPAAKEIREQCNTDRHITDLLNDEAMSLSMSQSLPSVSHLTAKMHVYPDFHGNRSPIADAELTGMILGLTLSSDKEDLIKKYIATLQALAYSTKHIISHLQESGHVISTLILCGGLAKNKLYLQMHADVTGLPVIVPHKSEPVLLGAAILAATAAGDYPNLISAMENLCGEGEIVEPLYYDKSFHEKKYEVFLHLLQCQNLAKTIMAGK